MWDVSHCSVHATYPRDVGGHPGDGGGHPGDGCDHPREGALSHLVKQMLSQSKNADSFSSHVVILRPELDDHVIRNFSYILVITEADTTGDVNKVFFF